MLRFGLRATFICCYLVNLIDHSKAQSPFVISNSCRDGQFFDTAGVECLPCNSDSSPSSESLQGGYITDCTCDAGFWLSFTEPPEEDPLDFGSCQQCPEGRVPAKDRRYCVLCDTSSGPTWSPARISADGTACRCETEAPDRIITNVGPGGALLTDADGTYLHRCVRCPNGTRPDPDAMACVSCKYPRFWDGERCACPAVVPEGSRCSSDSDFLRSLLPGSEPDLTVVFRGVPGEGGSTRDVTVGESGVMSDLLERSATGCYETGDREACNALGNLCVLQLHDRDSLPCQLYQQLVESRQGRVYHADDLEEVGWSFSLPWLYYPDDVESFLRSNEVRTRLRLGGGNRGAGSSQVVSQLSFRIARYALNGTFLGWQSFAKQFQLCGAAAEEQDLWTTVALNYRNRCTVSIADLLDYASEQREPEFIDLYFDDGGDVIVPVPIILENIAGNEDSSAVPALLTRRLFVVDAISGIESLSPPGSHPAAIRYLEKFHLEITLQDGDSRAEDGHIFPPTLRIRYASRALAGFDGAENPADFRVLYKAEKRRIQDFINTWDYMIISAMVLALIIGLVRLLRAYRASNGFFGNPMELIIQVIVTAADVGSGALFFVLFFVSLYWVCFFKLQSSAHTILPADDGEVGYRFRVCIISTVIGRVVAILWMVWHQSFLDIFLFDRTAPREFVDERRGVLREFPTPCWRTLFIANEWNEIQTLRQTSLEFTMFMAVFLLGGIELENGAKVTPDATDLTEIPVVETSQLLRFGISSIIFLIIEVFGVVAMMFLRNYRLGDPLRDFVDLLSLSNISFLILDNRAGFFLHGEFSGPEVDTDAKGLAEALAASRAMHGFTSDAEGGQTYVVFVTDQFRKECLEFLRNADARPVREESQTATRDPKDSAMDQQERGHSTRLREHLVSVFDDIRDKHRDHVQNPSLFQQWTLLPPREASDKTILWRDTRKAFSSVIFYGNELSLFMMQVMVFAAIDMSVQSAALSGAVTYIVMFALTFLRDELGKSNISKKAFIDKRFLI